MPYVDKVQVGGTDYDIQDTNAQTKINDLNGALSNVKLAGLSSVEVVSNAVSLTGIPTLNRIDLLNAFYTVENNTVKRTIIIKVKVSFENSDTYTLGTLSGLSPADVNPATNTVFFYRASI